MQTFQFLDKTQCETSLYALAAPTGSIYLKMDSFLKVKEKECYILNFQKLVDIDTIKRNFESHDFQVKICEDEKSTDIFEFIKPKSIVYQIFIATTKLMI